MKLTKIDGWYVDLEKIEAIGPLYATNFQNGNNETIYAYKIYLPSCQIEVYDNIYPRKNFEKIENNN